MNKTILLLLLSILAISACTTTNQEEPTIAATFAPLYDLTSTVAQDVAQVYSVVPVGVDPHVFEPGPQDIRQLTNAQAFVTLGIEFEAFEEQLKNNVREDTLIIPAAQGIQLLDGKEHHDEHAHEENHEAREHSDDRHEHEEHHIEVEFHEEENKIEYHADLFLPTPCHSIQENIMYEDDELIITLRVQQPEGDTMCAQVVTQVAYESEVVLEQYVHEVIILFEGEQIFEEHLDELHHNEEHDQHDHHYEIDPHVWLSPNNAILMVQNIRSGLVQAFPEDEETITANAQELIEELELLAQDYAQGLSNCEKDTIIVAHNAYSYLAQDYNFHTITISGLNHESEPSPQQLRRLIDQAREHNVSIIFFEELASPRVAETIAQATGAETRMLNPLESGRTNYLDGMQENLYNLQEALKCQ